MHAGYPIFEITWNRRKQSSTQKNFRTLGCFAKSQQRVKLSHFCFNILLSQHSSLIMRDHLFIDTHAHAHAHFYVTLPSPLPPRIHSLTGDDDITSSCTPRQQLALGYSKIRYLRNYCINVGRASEIQHGLSFLFLLQSFSFSRRG